MRLLLVLSSRSSSLRWLEGSNSCYTVKKLLAPVGCACTTAYYHEPYIIHCRSQMLLNFIKKRKASLWSSWEFRKKGSCVLGRAVRPLRLPLVSIPRDRKVIKNELEVDQVCEVSLKHESSHLIPDSRKGASRYECFNINQVNPCKSPKNSF